ncbi:hypothetical protein M5K25_025528 [Dendrobium thyrsiflorum]|uniref:Uncharacterized protein n=1 Tax=Dendrobium thyrsiflorum TaxID=117978 RepID=A0ABD0U4E9_DENTH
MEAANGRRHRTGGRKQICPYERRSEGLGFKITVKDRFGFLRWRRPVLEEYRRECGAPGEVMRCTRRSHRIRRALAERGSAGRWIVTSRAQVKAHGSGMWLEPDHMSARRTRPHECKARERSWRLRAQARGAGCGSMHRVRKRGTKDARELTVWDAV